MGLRGKGMQARIHGGVVPSPVYLNTSGKMEMYLDDGSS